MQKMYQENIRNKTTKSKSQKITLKNAVHVQKNTSLESPGLVSRTRIATSATSLHKGHLQDLHWLDYFGSNQIRIDELMEGPEVLESLELTQLPNCTCLRHFAKSPHSAQHLQSVNPSVMWAWPHHVSWTARRQPLSSGICTCNAIVYLHANRSTEVLQKYEILLIWEINLPYCCLAEHYQSRIWAPCRASTVLCIMNEQSRQAICYSAWWLPCCPSPLNSH